MSKGKKKIIIIGLDGATFDLIDPLVADGKLPHLEKLIKGGVSGELRSTIPPVTAPAWITFLTGKNPGNHGAYNFRTFDLTKYSSFREEVVNTNWFHGETIFEILSRNDLKVGALGVPMTYPPFKVNGFIVASGAPRMIIDESSVYPKELLSKIGKFEMPLKFGKENRDYFIKYMGEHLKKHIEVSEIMLKRNEYDLFMVVFGNTDWAAHQYWEYTDPSFPTYEPSEAQKFKNVISDQYVAVDKAVGKIMSYADPDTVIMLMSDHGSGVHPVKNLNINNWLKDKNLLKVKGGFSIIASRFLYKFINRLKNRLARYRPLMSLLRSLLPSKFREGISSIQLNTKNIVWGETRAYWVPFIPMFDGIVINKKGKQPQGIVGDNKEYDELRNHLKDELLKIKDPENGQPVVEKVFFKEEIFTGKYLDNAPDIVIMFHETYTGTGKFSADLIEPIDNAFLSTDSGFHRLNGIFIAYGKDIQKGKKIADAEIIDLPKTVLYCLNTAIPDDMEGKVLRDVFNQDFLDKNTERYIHLDEKDTSEKETTSVSAEDEEQMKKTLKGLGYM